jgi:hypothetical protein
MSRIHDHDDSSVTVAIIPQTCGNCGARPDRVRMSLEVVTGDGFIGLQTVAETPCCGGKRNSAYPPDHLARLLNHLEHCNNDHH